MKFSCLKGGKWENFPFLVATSDLGTNGNITFALRGEMGSFPFQVTTKSDLGTNGGSSNYKLLISNYKLLISN